ncbi:MAG: sigma-70 family RNA polymerase sigma factor, partial [Chitinophagaceae bacterium]
QQLFLDIWNQGLYRNIQKSLKAYLHTSIKHRCLNHIRISSRQTRHLHEYAGQLEIDTSEGEAQTSPQLLTALDGLPTQQMKAFHLIHMENKRYQDAAQEMGISINSLKSHLKLAVKFVRIKLKTSPIHPSNK